MGWIYDLVLPALERLKKVSGGGMIQWLKRRRLNTARVKLAGYEAKLRATQEMAYRPGVQTIPGAIVGDIQTFAQIVAELRELIRQLEAE